MEVERKSKGTYLGKDLAPLDTFHAGEAVEFLPWCLVEQSLICEIFEEIRVHKQIVGGCGGALNDEISEVVVG